MDKENTLAGAMAPPRESFDAGARQLCFDPKRLFEKDLDVAAFVADTRTHAPLTIIRDDLQAHLKVLSRELIHRIQTDFAQFVSLGPSVSDADTLVASVTAPLGKVRGELEELRLAIAGNVAELDAALASRRLLANRKTALQLLLRISELVHKCERLLKEMSSTADGDLEQWKTLERVCGEWSQLSSALSRSPHRSKFISALNPRLARIRHGVSSSLERWLRRALADGGEEAGAVVEPGLAAVLAAFVVAGMVERAREVFKDAVTVPFVGANLRMVAAMARAEKRHGFDGTIATPAEALEAAVEAVGEFLERECGPVLKLCAANEHLREVDLLPSTIWPQVEGAIVSEMAPVFSPGIANVFHRSFLAACALFESMEKYCFTDETVKALRMHAATADFWRRWNLPVYFQLRFQEITNSFGVVMDNPPEFADTTNDSSDSGQIYQLLGSDAYQLTASKSMIGAIRRCWDSGVYLPPLTHRFLRLTLQVLSRYVTWAREGLEGGWTDRKVLLTGAAGIFSDMEIMRTRLPAEIASLLRIRATSIPNKVLKDIDSAIADATGGITDTFGLLSDTIVKNLSTACAEGLQPLRGILATYRGMQRPAPTTHSRFVPNVLRPLRNFANDGATRLPDETVKSMAQRVIENTTERYYAMASDLLTNAKKAEESMKRLKLGWGTGGAAMSDSEKISMQLYLDASKFASEIESFGVAVADIPSYALLFEKVRDSSGANELTETATPAAPSADEP